jgi:hypothetical protein
MLSMLCEGFDLLGRQLGGEVLLVPFWDHADGVHAQQSLAGSGEASASVVAESHSRRLLS